jgi:pimeloyl-ACP methyl ester carboxylesterase
LGELSGYNRMMPALEGNPGAMDVHLPIPSLPPLWREGMIGLEAASLMRSSVWKGNGVPPGDGRPVLLIPGYLAGDGSLALMTRWLRALGYRTRRAGMRVNIDCSAAVCRALEERLERMADLTGQRVSIVGQSRGGIIARAVAVRRPDLVSGIVTLGSPVRGMLNIHPLVLGSIGVVAALGTLRMPHLFSVRCLRGECCHEFRDALRGEFPENVDYVGVYSKRDGIVSWRACLDTAATEMLEVASSHCGMAVHPDVYGIVGRSLARFAQADDIPVWTEWARAA